MLFLDQLCTKNYTNWARIGAIHLSQLEVWGLEHLSQKGLDDIYHRSEGMHFSRKKHDAIVVKFLDGYWSLT